MNLLFCETVRNFGHFTDFGEAFVTFWETFETSHVLKELVISKTSLSKGILLTYSQMNRNIHPWSVDMSDLMQTFGLF